MVHGFRVALAQINCTVGDLRGNCRKIADYVEKAGNAGADLVCFPELTITGYPPEDLLLKPKFIEDNIAALRELARSVGDMAALVGFVDRNRKHIYDAAAVIYDGRIRGIHHKAYLPNYAVFDEKRYFRSGRSPLVFKLGPVLFGVTICEDIWYKQGPARAEARAGARIVCSLNASPYHAGKIRVREEIVRTQATDNDAAFVYTNLVGGQDELVFDGQSMVVDRDGRLVARAEAFKEDLVVVDLEVPESSVALSAKLVTLEEHHRSGTRGRLSEQVAEPLPLAAEVYQALLLGLRDYVLKNGFKKVVIGLSGGVDSALVAVLAADALGRENVACAFMPSGYSSRESDEDAGALAKNLGVELLRIPIQKVQEAYLETLGPFFKGMREDITEENLQARIRGNILMALSNKFGWLVLTTGNKSEMSVGYATLYGDMAGGFAVIKDVPKTLVYKVCVYRNSLGPVIPERILVKAPSAELKPDQKDTDTLPPYEVLDPILKAYVEEDKDWLKIVSNGYTAEMVQRVIGMVDKSEYKRRQSPPGIRITPKAFGKDRRMPITSKYRG